MVKDYIGKFDTRQATGFDLDGVAGMSTVTAQNWALTAGLRVQF